MISRLLSPFFVLAVLAVPFLGQTPDTPPPQASSPAATPASSKAIPNSPKRIWNNDNLSGAKGPVSVVGDKRSQNCPMSPNQPADAATVSRINKDLEKLQGQLDDVNKKLKSYKEFQDGEAVSKGERDLDKYYSRVPVDQQMAKLLDKKKELEGQIGDLYDEARKKGIDPGQLR